MPELPHRLLTNLLVLRSCPSSSRHGVDGGRTPILPGFRVRRLPLGLLSGDLKGSRSKMCGFRMLVPIEARLVLSPTGSQSVWD